MRVHAARIGQRRRFTRIEQLVASRFDDEQGWHAFEPFGETIAGRDVQILVEATDIDGDDVDWQFLAELVETSYRGMANSRQLKALDSRDL